MTSLIALAARSGPCFFMHGDWERIVRLNLPSGILTLVGASVLNRGDQCVVPFAFSQQQVPAEDQVIHGDGAGRGIFPRIIQINPASFDVFSPLSFALA